MKRLSEAEAELMQILWEADEPSTSVYIQEKLRKYRVWKLPAVMNALSRLIDKGFVECDRSTRTNYYSPLVAEKDYKKFESEYFLDKMFNNSLSNMVSTLFDEKNITEKDIDELKKIIKEYEEE